MGPLFEFLEAPGPFAVSLEVVELTDRSRPPPGLPRASGAASGRPLQTLVWRPAEPGGSDQMTVGAYLDLWDSETRFDRPRRPARASEWREGMSASLDDPMRAFRRAAPLEGRFPIVVYAPSFSSVAWENADLCEYLASHGFVVVASPCMGGLEREMTADLAGLSAQAADISFLAGFAQTLPHTDPDRIAAAGFSWGGLSNVVAAGRDPRIQALVCLDGSLRYWPGLLKTLEDVRPDRMTVPLISFAKADWTLEEQARYLSPAQIDGPNILNAWRHADVVLARSPAMTHRQFSSMFQRNADVLADFEDPAFIDGRPGDHQWSEGVRAYGWVCRYALAFLKAYLCSDVAALQFLRRSPGEHGAPDHCLQVAVRPGTGLPVSWRSFRAAVEEKGVDHLVQVYDAVRGGCPDFVIESPKLLAWAEDMLDQARIADALQIARFNLGLHAEASAAHSAVGRILELAGKPAEAAVAYESALAICDFDAAALRGVRRLSGRAPA